jgi:hypothetical protein
MIMKKILLAMVGIAFFSTTFAQNKLSESKFHFSAGAELGIATGALSDAHSVGIGASAQAEYTVAPNTNVTLSIGIISYAGKKVASNNAYRYSTSTIVPVKGGIKYFLSGGFYAAAQLGVGFLSNYVDVHNTNPTYPYGIYDASSTALAYTPMIGYEFRSNSGKAFDASFKYDGYSTQGASFGSVGLRLAYKFK